MAAFANWCCREGIAPHTVDDACLQKFLHWLTTRSLYPKPPDLARRVPNVWNEASTTIALWPKIKLAPISFRMPCERVQWADLSPALAADAEVYLASRAKPDLFDDSRTGPTRALAPATLRLQRDHIRLAASVLIQAGTPAECLRSLADLVTVDRFIEILRHYHDRRNGEPNAFVIGLSKTLIDVARYHVGITADKLASLKRMAAKLPPVALDLTAKNKAVLRQLESERLQATLLFLPETLLAEAARSLKQGTRLRFVDAQVAIAIDLLLVVPLRPQNLSSLNWGRHFREPDGARGRLMMYIPAHETKGKRREIAAEIPVEVARRLRWYRRTILPQLKADPNGSLFVTEGGQAKSQETLTDQIISAIIKRVGIRMTPHQFRHFCATSYLAANPEDFETVRQVLGHARTKTTLIYGGARSERSIGAYNRLLFERREAMRLKRGKRLR